MNVLILSSSADRVGLTLCVKQGAVQRVLEGEVTSAPAGAVNLRLRDAQGFELYQSSHADASLATGLKNALYWLVARKIRVDVVVHRIPVPSESDRVLRLPTPDTPDMVMRLDPLVMAHTTPTEASKHAFTSVQVVADLNLFHRQFAFLSVWPHSPESVCEAVEPEARVHRRPSPHVNWRTAGRLAA